MAVDPKQVLQRNVPLIVCYVAAIVPVVLWFVLVESGLKGGKQDSYSYWAGQFKSKKGALDTITKTIDKTKDSPNALERFATPDLKKKLEDRTTELNAQSSSMIKLIGDRDLALERWLATVGELGPGKLPLAAEFQTKLTTAIDELKKEYADLVIDPVAKTVYVSFDPVAEGNQKKIQKEFWVVQNILKALKKAGTASTTDLVPIRLLAPIDFGMGAGVAPPDKGKIGPLTVGIPAKFVVLMSMRDISKVARELLAQDIVFRLKSLHTELFPFTVTRPELGLTVNLPDGKVLYEQAIYNGTQDQGKKLDDEELIFPEPKIKVSWEVEAVDFDMDAINPSTTPTTPEKK